MDEHTPVAHQGASDPLQTPSRVCLAVPCYNEAARLLVEDYVDALDRMPWLHLMLVDDASTDDTAQVLDQLHERRPGQTAVLRQARNGGKSKAVQAGLLRALRDRPAYVGYWDADLATPLDEAPRMVQLMEDQPRLDLVMGSRVKMLGRTIKRRYSRHVMGRLFAAYAAMKSGLPIYDSQCGAKLLRVNERTADLFDQPFRSRWLLDLELILRLKAAVAQSNGVPLEQRIYEMPLHYWEDKAGSKVSPLDLPRSLWELHHLTKAYQRQDRLREVV